MAEPEEIDNPRSELFKRVLRRKLEAIHDLVSTPEFETRHLDPVDFHEIAGEYDRVLARLSGVSKRDRSLAWLRESVERMAAETLVDPTAAGGKPRTPLSALARFSEEALGELPPRKPSARHAGFVHAVAKLEDEGFQAGLDLAAKSETIRVGAVVRFLTACVATRRAGRRPQQSRPIPIKWEAFHQLAIELGLIDETVDVDNLRRSVLRAQRGLKSPGPAAKRG